LKERRKDLHLREEIDNINAYMYEGGYDLIRIDNKIKYKRGGGLPLSSDKTNRRVSSEYFPHLNNYESDY
jgi:hypothetical protein